MNKDDEEQNLALYIDELKSDDNILKIKAIEKLQQICAHLSQRRIETELFPYLQYIVEEIDNEEDFLVAMGNSLKNYLKTRPSINLNTALDIIESLLLIDDALIRNVSIEILIFIARQNISSVMEVINKLYKNESLNSLISIISILEQLQQNNVFDISPQQINKIDDILMEMVQHRVLKIKRLALRSLIYFYQNNQYKSMRIFNSETLEMIKEMYLKAGPEGLLTEIYQERFLDSFFRVASLEGKQLVQERAFYFLKEISHQWRIKYLILNSKTLISIDHSSFFFYYEVFEELFKSKEQEIKTSTVRALTILLHQINSIEKMQEFWSVFENFIKNTLMPSQNIYVKKNFLIFLEVLLTKGQLAEKYAIESFVMFLEYFSFQDYFNEAKISSMQYVGTFINCMQGKFSIQYDRSNLKPFKKTEHIVEEKQEEEQNVNHKGIKDEIPTVKVPIKKEQAEEHFEDKGVMKDDLLLRLNSVCQKTNWKLRFSLLEKISQIITSKIPNDKEEMSLLFDLNFALKDDVVLINRKTVIKNLLQFHNIMSKESVKKSSLQLIENWIIQKNFIFRVTALQTLFDFFDTILTLKEIENFLKTHLNQLKNENVINVKINVLKLYWKILQKCKRNFILKTQLSDIQQFYKKDKDADIQFYLEELKNIEQLILLKES